MQIDYRGDATIILFARPRRWFNLVPIFVMMLVWFFGGMFAVIMAMMAFENDPLFTQVFIAFWGLAGLSIICAGLFNVFAREYLVVRASDISHVHRLFGINWPDTIDGVKLKTLQFIHDNPRRQVTVNGRKIPQTALLLKLSHRDLYVANGVDREGADRAIRAVQERIYIRDFAANAARQSA